MAELDLETLRAIQEMGDTEVQQPTPIPPSIVPSEILELELNYEKSLDALERKLRGQTLVLKGKQRVWEETETPWMNNEGITRIIAIIKGHIDVNTFLTILEDTVINQISHEIADEMTTILSNKCEDFDIEATYLGILLSMIINNIYFALQRAKGGTTLKQIHSITTRAESPLQLEKEKQRERRGFLGRFF